MSRRPFRMSDTGILLMRSVREPPQCGDLRTSFTGPTTSFILDCFPPTSPKETRVRSTASCTRSSKACDGRLRALRGGASSDPPPSENVGPGSRSVRIAILHRAANLANCQLCIVRNRQGARPNLACNCFDCPVSRSMSTRRGDQLVVLIFDDDRIRQRLRRPVVQHLLL